MFSSTRARFEVLLLISLVCLALAIVGGLLWANAMYLRHAPIAREFLVPWLGLQAFLRDGHSPYSDATAQHIQRWYYGRLARTGEDPLRVATPFFVLLLYSPYALLSDYALAFNLWMLLNEIALGILACLLLRLPAWRPARWFLPVFFLCVLCWPHALLALLSGGTAVLAVLGAVGALFVLKAGGKDEWAGVLAALALLQPSVTGLLVLYLFIWASAHRRWGMVGGFSMLLCLWILLAFFLLPDWFWPWARNVLAERPYNPAWSPADFFQTWLPGPGQRLGWLLTGGLGLLLIIEWLLSRRQDARHFLWTAGLTLALTPLLGARTVLAGQVALLFPLTLVLFLAGRRWGRSRQRWLPYSLLMLVFLSFWIWSVWLVDAGRWNALQTLLFWFLPVVLSIGLYWLRWYAFCLPPTWLEEEL